ncbi:MAG: hypothetical protein ACE5LU_28995, partial [Anaerolineae bacterium]
MTSVIEFDTFLRSIIETLERLGLLYMIGGSVASSIYGEARSTRDVDVSVVLPLEQVGSFVQAFQSLGYYIFADVIIDAIIAHQPFNIIDAQSGYKADIFVVDPQNPTPLEQQALQRRRYQIYDETSGAQAVLYSPEDVIVYKLKYYLEGRMPKHLRDIGAMLFVQGEVLDYGYIAEWAERIGAADV